MQGRGLHCVFLAFVNCICVLADRGSWCEVIASRQLAGIDCQSD